MDNPQEPNNELKKNLAAEDDTDSPVPPPGAGANPPAPPAADAANADANPPVPPAADAANAGANPLAPPAADAANADANPPVPPAADAANAGANPPAPPAAGAANAGANPPAPPAAGAANAGANPPVPPAGGAGSSGGPLQTLNLKAATPSPVVADLRVVASETRPLPITIGKKLSLWLLTIMAGSILLLVIYLWHMENSAADDVRQNYGKELNRDNVAFYMRQHIQRFSNDLAKAQSDPSYVAPKNNAFDDKALSDTLGSLPDVTDEQRSQLTGCVSLISSKQVDGSDRKAALQPCVEFLEQQRNDGLTAATAAMSYQMASDASAKLLEQRTNLHEFWLKAAQLILLNLLLPLLTAVIGYTFGNQAGQSQGSSLKEQPQ